MAGEPASSQDLRTLQAIMSGHSEVHRPLLELYRETNGAALCILWEDINEREVAALTLLPVEDWDPATEPWVSGDMASFMQGCEVFTRGTWKVIAQLPSEGQSLVYFFDGVCGDKPLAGSMFCIGLDGLLGLAADLAAVPSTGGPDPAAEGVAGQASPSCDSDVEGEIMRRAEDELAGLRVARRSQYRIVFRIDGPDLAGWNRVLIKYPGCGRRHGDEFLAKSLKQVSR